MKNEKNIEEIVEEVAEEIAEEVEESSDKTEKTIKKLQFVIAGMSVLLVIVSILAVYAFCKLAKQNETPKGKEEEKTPVAVEELTEEELAAQAEEEKQAKIEENNKNSHHMNDYGFGSWTIYHRTAEDGINLQYYYMDENGKEVVLSADDVNKLLNMEVATCGDNVLTNRLLQNYYFETYANFTSYYGDYMAYIMDPTLPLDAQLDGTLGDGTGTWQRTFLEDALTTYKMTAALVQEAEAVGFVLTEEQQAQIDMACDLDAQAAQYGMANGLELVKMAIGPAATVESYQQYAKDTLTASFYMEHLSSQIEVTDEEAEAYYEENKDMFTEGRAKGNVDVRHILIAPEAAADGTVSDAAWVEAEREANRILAEFTSGEQTEEAFGTLASTYTTDPGSMENGGLYEGVYPGQMVPTFNDWCFDEARVIGDTGVVKTDYGYHIMYFVGESNVWFEAAKSGATTEKISQLREDIMAKYETSMDMRNMIILEAGK